MQNISTLKKVLIFMVVCLIASSILYFYMNLGGDAVNVKNEEVGVAMPDLVEANEKEYMEKPSDEDGSFVAYLTNVEMAKAGIIFSFDYVTFDTNVVGAPKLINNNPKIREFLALPSLQVGYDFTNGMNGDKYYGVDEYVKLLRKEGEHYRNLSVYEDSYQHGDLYEIEIKDGVVVKMFEVGDFTRPQGTL